MEPSMRIIPAAPSKSASLQHTANSLGTHNTLRYGPRSIAAEIKSSSGLEHRLAHWEETQDNLKMTMLRDLYGLHTPARVLMERKVVSKGAHMPALQRSNIHLDILMGRDETLDPSDFFLGMEHGPPISIHSDMEKKLRM
ncbi:hypothetical protein ID866_5805 [Astraeus odoratus]|nr:hypothetical protein ID866_5805 [Astraeus odoratus]